jgi:hypothetical protein
MSERLEEEEEMEAGQYSTKRKMMEDFERSPDESKKTTKIQDAQNNQERATIVFG